MYLPRKQPKLVKLVGAKAAKDTNFFVLCVRTSSIPRSLECAIRIGQRYVPQVRGQWPSHANDISHRHVVIIVLTGSAR